MDNVRKYPDVHFVDTDTETLVNNLIRSFEEFTGRTLYPADPMRLVILWMASVIVQNRVNIDFSARQNVPRYAEGIYLDSIAELFKDVYRLEPEKAKTVLRYTLSVERDSATVVPAGIRATVDGEIIFQTLEELIIPAGSLTGDVPAECLTAGTVGNGFVPGQISQPIDIFPFFQSVENVSESDGGADEESDDALYARMRESMETFSTAGPLGGYEYYAKTASALISDVKASSPSPGEVDVRVLLSGGELPGEEILNAVSAILSADDVRPLTDHVTVAAPETVPYDIDFTYWTQEGGARSAEAVAQNVAAAVQKYKEWQGAKMGRDVNPSYLISLIMGAGAKRVQVRSPVDTVVPDNAVALIGETTVVNGGAESE